MSETAHHASRVEPDAAVVADFAADYVDAFAIEGPTRIAARAWADSSLHGSDAAGGLFRTVVWHGLLRFDLADADEAGTAFGWRVSTEQDCLVVMDVDGPLAAGRMIFTISHDTTTWTTMLRFHRRTGRVLWAILGHGHRALAPSCLDQAATYLRRAVGVTAQV